MNICDRLKNAIKVFIYQDGYISYSYLNKHYIDRDLSRADIINAYVDGMCQQAANKGEDYILLNKQKYYEYLRYLKPQLKVARKKYSRAGIENLIHPKTGIVITYQPMNGINV